MRRHIILSLAISMLLPGPRLEPAAPPHTKVFRAGAYAIDITPAKFPVIVNGYFEERTVNRASDPLFARCLVLDDGKTKIAIVVVDNLMMPRELLDRVKKLIEESSGIPADHILISATHTHSAPAVMGCLGSRSDPEYAGFLEPQLVRGLQLAVKNLRPAQIGWGQVADWEHTHNRRWIRRPDRIGNDPFGHATVRANMHPGYQNPDVIAPSGPVDPDISLLSVRTPQGRPIALLANYSMHYFGSTPVSADYFGHFAEQIRKLIGADKEFVGIMSQGTSGDLMWMDYGQPKQSQRVEDYAAAVARVAHEGYQKIHYHDWAPLAMREAKLTLGRRVPNEKRLAWARQVAEQIKGAVPVSRPEIYALEQLYLHKEPTRELKLQAIRIGELGITALPNEVFALTGLKLKLQSPLATTFNIELANGAEGYIPPPEQHQLGGYTTWPARTAGLVVSAEPKIVETLLTLLEDLTGKPRRKLEDVHGPYPQAVLASKPVAYWRMTDMSGSTAVDTTGTHPGTYQDGVALFLEGPAGRQFSGGTINRAVHFAGGRLRADVKELGSTYSVEMWFWNGLPNDARPITGCMFSRGPDGEKAEASDQLGVGGTHAAAGRLLFFNGLKQKQALSGGSEIKPKTWHHVVLVRDARGVTVYLDGLKHISGETEVGSGAQLFFGGRTDGDASWEGKLDEIAVYKRALPAEEVARHFQAAGMPPPAKR